jgi:hypothetical protein
VFRRMERREFLGTCLLPEFLEVISLNWSVAALRCVSDRVREVWWKDPVGLSLPLS